MGTGREAWRDPISSTGATEPQRGCAGDSPGGHAGQGSGDGCSCPAAQGQEAGAPPLHFPRVGQGACAGPLCHPRRPTWGHIWGSGGPCAGLSHPSRGRSPSGCPAWPERLGSVAVRQGEAGL